MKTVVKCGTVVDMNRLLSVCTGHRCAALLEHSCDQALPLLRTAVRASPDVVLVSTGCVGACAQAPVMALSEGVTGPAGQAAAADEPAAGATRLAARRTTWLGPVGPAEVDGLCAWAGEGRHTSPLPGRLRQAVFHPVAP